MTDCKLQYPDRYREIFCSAAGKNIKGYKCENGYTNNGDKVIKVDTTKKDSNQYCKVTNKCFFIKMSIRKFKTKSTAEPLI